MPEQVIYRLEDRYILRGWEDRPTMIVNTMSGFAWTVTEREMSLLERCDGVSDLSELGEKERKFLRSQEDRKRIVRCQTPDPVDDFQRYRKYGCNYMASFLIAVTGRCNLKCRHCFMEAPEGKMGQLSTEQMMNLIDQLADCGIASVEITGGEPLIRPDFWDIVDHILSKRIHISAVYTNAVLLDDRMLDGFEKRNLHPAITVSFDGIGWHD